MKKLIPLLFILAIPVAIFAAVQSTTCTPTSYGPKNTTTYTCKENQYFVPGDEAGCPEAAPTGITVKCGIKPNFFNPYPYTSILKCPPGKWQLDHPEFGWTKWTCMKK